MKMVKLLNRELKIMKIIWNKKITNSNEIIQLLGRNWNVSTIRNLIRGLLNKKVIVICKKEGKRNIYKANIDKKTYIRGITKDFIEKCIMIESED